MRLNELRPAAGAKKREKRIGRGPGSGHGKTATKGHKGAKARSGGGKQPGFEGGQMPLLRRVPKRGFRNTFRIEFAIVNLKDLNGFDAKQEVTPEALLASGLIRAHADNVKILGEGQLSKPLVIRAHKFSASALEKIKQAGGRAEVIAAAAHGKQEAH
jgi:large subunit ribosomal protein L15